MKPKTNENMRVGKPAAPAKNEAGAFVPAEKWLEHLEEEIEPKCLTTEKKDLELVLKNSPEDLAVCESLKRVRAAVKSLSGDVALPESGHYYDNLHAKIMAAIDDDIAMNGEPIRVAAKPRAPMFKRGLFSQPVFGLAGMMMMVAILAFVGLNRTSTPSSSMTTAAAAHASLDENFERKIASLDSHVGAAFAHEMGSFESEEDFLTESAAQRLKQLSSAQADALIHTLSR